MKKIGLYLTAFLMVACSLMTFTPALAAETLRVSYTDIDHETGNKNWQGQTFTTTTAFSATSFEIYAKREGAGTGLTVHGRLETVSGGIPTKTVIAEGDISLPSVSTSYAWVKFTFAMPVLLSASTQYAICWGQEDATEAYLLNYDKAANPYAGGQAFYSTSHIEASGSWTASPTYDKGFKIYGEDPEASVVNTLTATYTDAGDVYYLTLPALVYSMGDDTSLTANIQYGLTEALGTESPTEQITEAGINGYYAAYLEDPVTGHYYYRAKIIGNNTGAHYGEIMDVYVQASPNP